MINLKELPFYEEVYEEGKMEGKIEGKKEVARNLLKLGIKINEISIATGLSEEDLKEIEKSIKEEAVDSHLNKPAKSKKNIKL